MLLLVFSLGFVLIWQVEIPERVSIQSNENIKTVQKEVPKINIRTIYEQDLFGTYVKKAQEPMVPNVSPQIPQAPQPTQLPIPKEAKQQFVDPLRITLKGIIIIAHDDRKNRAIISDNTTNKEAIYKVEDTIDDARLIKIYNNKVIFLRANGQQEVLYLRKNDAEKDPTYSTYASWDEIIEPINNMTYRVYVPMFIERIQNIAQIIDLLDLITVYQKGVSVGTRIGNVQENAFAQALGLQVGDIILSINDIPATDTENRMNIYKKIISMKTNDVVSISLKRQNNTITLHYILSDIKKSTPEKNNNAPNETEVKAAEKTHTSKEMAPKQLHQFQERHKFAPTLKDIRNQEMREIQKKGKAPTHLNSSNR